MENDPILSYSDSFLQSGSSGAVANLSGSISDGALHGYSQANTGTSYGGNGYSGLDAYFYDTFHITGAAGQSGEFQIQLYFDGSGVESGDPEIGDYVNSYNLLENGTVIPGQQYSGIVSTLSVPFGSATTELTTTVDLTLASDSSVVLGQLLQIRNVVVNAGNSGSVTIDDSDTGYFTVTPLTPGFGFSTDSGYLYNGAPSPTPEPASWPMTAAAFSLLCVFTRRLTVKQR